MFSLRILVGNFSLLIVLWLCLYVSLLNQLLNDHQYSSLSASSSLTAILYSDCIVDRSPRAK